MCSSSLFAVYFVCVLGDVLTVLIVSCIFSVLFSSLWSIFTTIILNSLSSRLFISSSFIWSCEFLPYSFICAVFICLFIFSKLAPIELSFSQTLGLHSFFLLLLPLEGKVSWVVCVDFLLGVISACVLEGGYQAHQAGSYRNNGTYTHTYTHTVIIKVF